jgi:hypothetical protein
MLAVQALYHLSHVTSCPVFLTNVKIKAEGLIRLKILHKVQIPSKEPGAGGSHL